MLFGLLLLGRLLLGVAGTLGSDVRDALKVVFQVGLIGLFVMAVLWSLRYLRAPDAERSAMEVKVFARLGRVGDSLGHLGDLLGTIMVGVNGTAIEPVADETDARPVSEKHSAPQLSVRQSRTKILLRAGAGLLGAVLMYRLILTNEDMGQGGRVFVALVTLCSLLDGARHLLMAIFARALLDVGPLGITAPSMYRPTIPWQNIIAVELSRPARRKRAPVLSITFAYPEGPSAWRGLRGKSYAFFLGKSTRAHLGIPLDFADHKPEKICATINRYLLDRGAAVVVRWVRPAREDFDVNV